MNQARPQTARTVTCKFCENPTASVDYKDTAMLANYLSELGKILPRTVTGNCIDHQRKITLAIKRSRALGL